MLREGERDAGVCMHKRKLGASYKDKRVVWV